MRVQNILLLFIILLTAGGIYYFGNMPEAPEPQEVKQYVWIIEMEEIEHITLDLPREGLSESWIKISIEDQFPWYFDDAENTPVDSERWGGGIPLLLSGPGAGRVIAENASPEKLEEFGLADPNMIISLELSDNSTMEIFVGDATPNRAYYYVQAPRTSDVALVDYTWYNVLSGLVTNPPYVPEEAE